MEDLEREAERMLSERGDRAPSSETLYANPEMRDRLRASARVDRTWEVGPSLSRRPSKRMRGAARWW
jgi:hypothetical protein